MIRHLILFFSSLFGWTGMYWLLGQEISNEDLTQGMIFASLLVILHELKDLKK